VLEKSKIPQDARRLLEIEGDLNRIVRLGSNLFAVMFTVVNGAEEVARRLESASRGLFGERLEVNGREISLAAKAGIAVYPDDGTDADALFRNAEAALKQPRAPASATSSTRRRSTRA
jgi:GGDEF domain-containing protein